MQLGDCCAPTIPTSDVTARSHHGLARSTAIDAAVLAVSQQELAGEPLSARTELDLISPESVWSERQAGGTIAVDGARV